MALVHRKPPEGWLDSPDSVLSGENVADIGPISIKVHQAYKETQMDLVTAIIAGQLRHVLTGLGAVLIAKGVVDTATAGTLVDHMVTFGAGLVTYGIGAAWSVFQKYATANLLK